MKGIVCHGLFLLASAGLILVEKIIIGNLLQFDTSSVQTWPVRPVLI